MNLQGVPLVADDLSIGGHALADAPQELVTMASSIATERHQAIGWLEGAHWLHSEVDTST